METYREIFKKYDFKHNLQFDYHILYKNLLLRLIFYKNSSKITVYEKNKNNNNSYLICVDNIKYGEIDNVVLLEKHYSNVSKYLKEIDFTINTFLGKYMKNYLRITKYKKLMYE